MSRVIVVAGRQQKGNRIPQTINNGMAREITSANGLTAALIEKLIAQVKVYPGNQLEIDWKINDFLIQ